MSFNLNDRIKMSEAGKRKYGNTDSNPHDKEGVIRIASKPGDEWIYVRWDNGRTNAYEAGQLELVEKVFKVGERVRLTAQGKLRYDRQAGGTTGTVTASTRSSKWTDVRWDNGNSNNYQLEDIELAPTIVAVPEPTPKPLKEKSMAGKEKTYTDRDGDVFEVDTLTSKEYVYFTTGEGDDGISEGQIVRMTRDDVKKIRKQLGKWLDRTDTSV